MKQKLPELIRIYFFTFCTCSIVYIRDNVLIYLNVDKNQFSFVRPRYEIVRAISEVMNCALGLRKNVHQKPNFILHSNNIPLDYKALYVASQ